MAREVIQSKTINTQTATGLEIKVYDHVLNTNPLRVYYVYYTATGIQIPNSEGSLLSSQSLSLSINEALLNAVLAVVPTATNVRLAMWQLYSNIYKFYYTDTNGENQALELSGSYIPVSVSNTLRSEVYTLLNAEVISTVYFNTAGAFSTLTRTQKPLLKIGMPGDSLLANFIGGDIPAELDEGATAQPIRLTVNGIARRLYDKISWNKPVIRRLDNPAWTKGGTWSTVSTFFEPSVPSEFYHSTNVAGSYAEIQVPDGMTHFAFICLRTANQGTISVTLNGGSIASYGPASVNCARAATTGEQIGNPYHTVEYHNLPSGPNTIRLTRSGSTPVRIWGGFYWSGTTVMVYNLGHGGHTMLEYLTEHAKAEVQENAFDGLVWELPLINEMTQTANDGTFSTSDGHLRTFLNTYCAGIPTIVMSCNPFGKNPANTSVNYYLINPGQKELNARLRTTVVDDYDLPFIDVFTRFEELVMAQGGSLVAGTVGLLYTTDGQHGNTIGVSTWWGMMEPVFDNVLNA